MADIYTKQDLKKLLENRYILFVGDHNMRNVYKDFICLYQTDELMELDHIARNLEESYLGDTLISRRNMYKERKYAESRIFKGEEVTLEYMFISQCCSPTLTQYLFDIFNGTVKAPDVIYMNSFLWDFTRWGPNPEVKYVANMYSLVELLKQCLPDTTLFIWATTNPVSTDAKDIPFVPQLYQVNETMYSDIIEGNHFAAELFRFYGYDVVDTYYHLFRHADRRSLDGVRYVPCALRYVTYLLLTHIALSWDVTLPGRIDGVALHEEISRSKEKYSTEKVETYWYESNFVKMINNARNTNTSVTDNYRMLTESFNEKLQLNPVKNQPESNSKPVIRVKATWEVLREFGDSGNDSSSGLDFLANEFARELEEEKQKDELEPISSSDNFSESDEGEICSVNSVTSNIIKGKNITLFNNNNNNDEDDDEESNDDDESNDEGSNDEKKPLPEERQNERSSLIGLNLLSNRNSSKEQISNFEPLSSNDELEEGEIGSDSSVTSENNLDKKSNFIKYNTRRVEKCVKDKPSEVEIKMDSKNEDLKVNEELEEGEIEEADEVEDLSAARNWKQWKKYRNKSLILNSDKDLVTLEIAKNRRGNRLWLRPRDYHRLFYRRDENSLHRIEGFIKQLKRKLIPSRRKRHNKRMKQNNGGNDNINSSLLFGYEKNERSELFEPKIMSNCNEDDSNENENAEEGRRKDKSIGWVADQWRRVIEKENEESVEVLSLWQRDVQSIEKELESIRQKNKEELEAFHREFKNKNISISFL